LDKKHYYDIKHLSTNIF